MGTSDPLHVVHVNSERGFSGGEQQLFLLLRGLRDRGHRNTLVGRPGGRPLEQARAEGFEVRAASMGGDLDLAGLLSLRRRLRELAPDVVTLHTGRAAWLGGAACRSLGLPAIAVRRMDRRVRRGPRTRWIYGAWTRRVVAIAPAVVDCLVAGGVPRERVALIHSSVDPARRAPAREPAAVRAAEGLAPGRLLLLTLASLDRRKGLDVLLEALALARARLPAPGPALWIAGEGPEREALQQQAARLGLGEGLRLLGRREDAPDLLAACDVFVLPSRREGLGVAALEAMAVGRPVLASRVGGLGQAVVDGGTGLLVPPGDAPALADALVRLAQDAALRGRLGAAGPARIAEAFHAETLVRRYEALYRAVIAEARGELNPAARGASAS